MHDNIQQSQFLIILQKKIIIQYQNYNIQIQERMRSFFSRMKSLIFPFVIGIKYKYNMQCQKLQDQQLDTKVSKIFFASEQCEHSQLKIFAFDGQILGRQITSHLDIALGRHSTLKFNDGQVNLQILDSVNGHKVFIIKSFQNQKINDGIMELLLAISSMKKAGATSIVCIIPYFPYSKVNTITESGNICHTFFAADIAKLIQSSGCDLIITLNAQLKQMKGFTQECSFINIECTQLVVPYLIHKQIKSPILIGNTLNQSMSSRLRSLGQTFAIFNTKCDYGIYTDENQYIGQNVQGRNIILFDNIIRTGHKLQQTVTDLKKRKAGSIFCIGVHGLCSINQFEKMINEMPIVELILTNTIYEANQNKKIRYVSVAKYLAQIISLIHKGKSLNEFRNERELLKLAFIHKMRKINENMPVYSKII